MPIVQFTKPFSFQEGGHINVSYRPSQIKAVSPECAAEAIKKGAAVMLNSAPRNKAQAPKANKSLEPGAGEKSGENSGDGQAGTGETGKGITTETAGGRRRRR